MIKLYYWQYSIPRVIGQEMCEDYFSGFAKSMSEPDIPEYAEVEQGYFLTLAELEQFAKECFIAGADRGWMSKSEGYSASAWFKQWSEDMADNEDSPFQDYWQQKIKEVE